MWQRLKLIQEFKINEVFIGVSAKQCGEPAIKDKPAEGKFDAVIEFIDKLGIEHPIAVGEIIRAIKIKKQFPAQKISAHR